MKKVILLITTIVMISCMAVPSMVACSPVEMSFDPHSDYGIYWFGDDNSDFVRSGVDMDTKYFDPEKPTFVFAHGWEPKAENSTNGLFEDFVTHKETISYTNTTDVRDYAKMLKEQGYNVACLSWFSYASSLGNLFKYIWVSFDNGYALSVRFAMELAMVLGDSYGGDVKMVGHSYGSQLALATTYQLIKLKKGRAFRNSHIIPTRLTLADPYFGATLLISNWSNLKNEKISLTGEAIKERAPKTLFADITEYIVKQRDIAVDLYFGMSVASTAYYKYDGSDADFEKLSKNATIVKSSGLKDRYGDVNIHNIVRDWTLLTVVDKVLLYDQNGDLGPSGYTTDSQIKALRGKCYKQVYNGFDVKADSLELVDRSTQTF